LSFCASATMSQPLLNDETNALSSAPNAITYPTAP
jgi:hypothetical protein